LFAAGISSFFTLPPRTRIVIELYKRKPANNPSSKVAVAIPHQIRGDGRAQGGSELKGHAEPNVCGMALQGNGRTGRRSGDYRDQARANRLPDGDSELKCENGRKQNAAADARHRR
jgi:hypothetical protein